jgi:hypothetical protein
MALTDNIVSYWKLDESSGSAVDSTSTTNLTLYGGITQGSAGKISTAYTFNGTTGYMGVVDTTYELTTAMSISCWVYLNAVDATQGLVCNYYWSGKGYDLMVESNNMVYWVVRDSAQTPTSAESISTSTLSVSTWYHIVATFDGTYTNLYINGSLERTSSAWAHNISYDAACRFGLGIRTDEFYLNGRLDEVGVWSRALTQTEITSLYNSGSGFSYPFSAANTYAGVLYIYNGSAWEPRPMLNYAPSTFTARPLHACIDGSTWSLIQSF